MNSDHWDSIRSVLVLIMNGPRSESSHMRKPKNERNRNER